MTSCADVTIGGGGGGDVSSAVSLLFKLARSWFKVCVLDKRLRLFAITGGGEV